MHGIFLYLVLSYFSMVTKKKSKSKKSSPLTGTPGSTSALPEVIKEQQRPAFSSWTEWAAAQSDPSDALRILTQAHEDYHQFIKTYFVPKIEVVRPVSVD